MNCVKLSSCLTCEQIELNVYDYIKDNLDRYHEDPNFFDNSHYLSTEYGAIEALGRPSVQIHPYVARAKLTRKF